MPVPFHTFHYHSCTSLGVKIGGGIGTAVVGWMLEFSGYVGTNATQPQSALDMEEIIKQAIYLQGAYDREQMLK